MSILWWEKTVEYFFVQKYVNLDMFIAPLDGNQEKGGDAIFSNESKWVLIEFKRDQDSIDSEIKKFSDYQLAKKTLEAFGSHHLIIYGQSNDDKFSLSCQEYFSGLKVSLEEALLSGVQKDTFLAYLNKLVDLKKQSKSGSGGYSFVAGVSSTGKVTKCMKLSEFASALTLERELKQKLQKKLEQSQEQTFDSPGMG
ncbi:hypothetical protein NAL94_14395 [Vibrio alginolyticus]|nr:hypothetical protein [Vibrio alginolyticus]QSI81600.1 hypothetical protein JYG29_04550 [Vibrio alginolyticus]URR29692.1 hypothetical protein NAL94_14395 [Vibrio alginolyticus]